MGCGLRDFYTENLGVNAPKFPVCACLIQKSVVCLT